jgi:hypothetical protein
MKQLRRLLPQFTWITLLVLVSSWAGATLQPQRTAKAEVRKSPPRQHFQAGGERALPTLQEISKTLNRIDARLARIERIATAAAGQ